MSDSGVAQQLTVRLPATLLQDARRIAKRRRVSLNRLVRELLERAAEEERNRVLKASYDLLGSDLLETDVEAFAGAQRDVVRRG